jgi:hypothetical protein
MTEAEWFNCADADELLGWVVYHGRQSDRLRALFLAACVAPLRPILADPRLRGAESTLEKFAEGACDFDRLTDECREAGYALASILDDPNEQRWFHAQVAAAEAVAAALHPESYEHLEYVIERCRRAIELFRDDVSRRWVRYQQAAFVRDIFGNPFRPVAFAAEWRSDTALSLAKHIYESRDFEQMPILADALQDAGCDNADVLNHCRDTSLTHVRGCWVVDLVLGKG